MQILMSTKTNLKTIPLREKVMTRIISVREGFEHPQTKTAEMLGIGQSTLALIETGDTKPSLDFIEHFCEVYKLNTAWVFGFTDGPIFNDEFYNTALQHKVTKELKKSKEFKKSRGKRKD